MYIEVLVGLKTNRIDKTFTYNVPNDLIKNIQIGKRVLVPFMNKKLEGFVLSISNNKVDYEVKDIIEIIDDEPILNSELLELGKYISKKTLSPLSSSYDAMLPSALKSKKLNGIGKKYVSYLVINKKIDSLTGKQLEIYNLIKEKEKTLKNEVTKISVSSVNTLLKKEIIKEIKEEIYRLNSNVNKLEQKIELNEDQKNVIKEVLNNKQKFKSYLLHGVTGSGKTEVYMNIIDEIIKDKKEAIVLVPEISLTPQMVDVFRNRFGSNIAVLHSRLSDGEKYDEYRKIQRKEVSIVVGARSAVFAPFTNIGVIIIDEEHSNTYKQENTPKYNAIDIAIKRAKQYNCPLILGSATPSIESYTRAKTNVYKLLELKHRINDSMPKCTLIDMKTEIKKGNRILSSLLIDKINDRLNKNEQVIILLNRRGYATTVTCQECGEVIKCPNCDIPLIYHKNSNNLRCHYCGYAIKYEHCPSCNSTNLNRYGLGTEKLEEELKKLFNARIIRMDVDTTTKKGSHEQIINSFKNREYDILIGTQMISKGLDFPYVTLVGVLNADASLNIPDFRSSERTFDLLNQVAGRAGRSSINGEVIMQSFNIEHYSIIKAINNDYIGFYNEEMSIRKTLSYPPFCNLSLIKIQGISYDEVSKEANKIKEYLKNKLNSSITILGPCNSNMLKLNNIYSLQIIIKYKKTEEVINEFKFILEKYRSSKLKVDIDLNAIKL